MLVWAMSPIQGEFKAKVNSKDKVNVNVNVKIMVIIRFNDKVRIKL